MKNKNCWVFLILFITNSLLGLEFYINSGREENSNFAILTLLDNQPFECAESYDRESEVSEISCKFDSALLSRFQRSETLFFSISPESFEDNTQGFFLKIKPKNGKKIKLYNTEFNLISGKMIPEEHNQKSKHWQVLGYENKLPFFNNQPSNGLNFPISFGNDLPSIGVLDVQMRPMNNEVGADKDHFLRIQSLVLNESYNEALNAIDEMLGIYPETIFKRDALYFKIVALDGLGKEENYEDTMILAKAWLEAYPTDIHVPQVLFVLARTYAKMNFFEEAKYYYDRLFNEHKGDKYELLARLDYGENLYLRGDRKVVLTMYESTLNETTDLDVASLASVLLGDYYRKAGNKAEAEKYLKNVLEANKKYFLKDIPKHYNMLQAWAEAGIVDVPAQVAEAMFETLEDEDDPLYLPILKSMAMWFDKAGNLEKAHQYYQLLLKIVESDAEKREIQNLDDSLLLNYNENNATKRLEHYDYVLQNYQGKEEAKKALEKKAQTLYDLQNYQAIFDMREELERELGENPAVLLNSLGALSRNALQTQNCKEAAYYGSLYQERIPLESDERLQMVDCLRENRQYTAAQKIAQVESQNAKTPTDKEKWLYRLAWVQYEMQDYPKASLAARDTLSLLSNPAYNDSAWVLFMSLSKQGRKEEAFEILPILEDKLKEDNKMIEVYKEVLQNALASREDTAIKVYANKLIALQKKYQRFEYSPWVELGLVEALNRESKFQESLDLLKDAESHISNGKEQIQIYYLQGYLNDKLGNKNAAIESYSQCESVQAESPWKNLCTDAKKLLEDKNVTQTQGQQ
ncbi:tetratricopeptide repeat protein [Helicobacter rodentium]|uniref:tetratricopeptide repeat protein n=6 Tax=Helicobacter rodentium TaxID=59617 RepID=UPI0023F21799|nr:flagellar functional protein [Helicobacter rodentium]